jgi:chromosome segregation protein
LYLKCIEMQGFKSFADRINLHFNKGLTSVVGPNGSGKSNISDAVRWVLGEQSAKQLRGSKMEDVIFAGTQHRKPVGFAQVTLVIDNSDKTLPLDFTEVTVSRRVYRSGESEYFINKTACRLKDIHELFMNTGVGKEGYSIIGQGRIDEILSNRSEDRRAIFEEAAGIMKYKVRKIEAERKLESTRQNLLRIEDIILELGSQLEPLREQAEKARQYLELSTELKDLEVSLYLDNIAKSQEKIDEIDSQFQGVQDNIQEETQRLEKKKQENREKTEKLDRLKKQLELLREELFNLDRDTGRLENQISINEEKIKHIESSNTAANQDIEGTRNRIAAMDADIEKRNKRLATLNRDKENFAQLLAEAEEKLAEIIARLDEGERRIELMKQEVMDKLDDLSECRTRLNSLKNEREAFIARKQKVDGEIRKTMLDRDRESMQLEEAMNELRRQKEALAQKKEIAANSDQDLQKGKKQLETLRSDQNKCLAELQAVKSRRKVLKDMENSLEGYSHSVRAILQACREQKELGDGIHGALAQLIHVRERFETAIEVALGAALQNIVVKDEYTAKDAIRYLKANNLGRATFLPISSVKPRDLDQGVQKRLEGEAGYLGTASEMIECAAEYRGIISNLLGRTVIVQAIDEGIAISRKYDYSFRVVTLDGEVLNPGGSMTGGSQPSKSSSLLSRNRIIRELEEKIEALSGRQEQLENECVKQSATLQQLEENIRLLQKELQDLELTVLREDHRVLGIQDNIKGFAARQEMLQAEKNELDGNISSCDREIEETGKRLTAIEESIAALKATIDEHQQKSREEQAKRDAVHMDINDYKVSVNSVLESLEQTKESIAHLNEEKMLLVENIQKRIEDKAKNKERMEALQSEIVNLQEKIKGQDEIKTGKNLKLEGLQEEVSTLEEEVSGMVDAITDYNDTIRILQDEYGKLEVRKARLTAELEALQNRLWDEYELTFGTAAEYKKEIQNIRQTQARITELKAAIRELGPVNVSAIEDYSKTKERHQFLSKQKEDLVSSEEKLNRVIHEMLSIMKRQFMEEFQKINQNFNQVFRELFDGGRAEVVLENPEDVLESGIDIIAQPPGKKLQNMLLLSGGERAMTAIAILFAILRMRPAPFCILDEIEAALDDANVYKFADYIRKFTKTTQFIVITHRKGTMESSDALYGVTMQEYGVSSVVSLKLGEPENQNAG